PAGAVAYQSASLDVFGARIGGRNPIARCEKHQLDPTRGKQWAAAYEQGIRPIMCERGKGGFDLAVVARLENAGLQPHCAGCRFNFFQIPSSNLRIARVNQYCQSLDARHELAQRLQSLRPQFEDEKIRSGEVSARPTKTGHESQPNRVAAHGEKDRNFRCGGLSCQCRRRTARGGDDSDSPPDKIGCKFRQTTDIIFSPTVFEGHVLTFDIAGLLESLTKFAQDLGVAVKRCRVEHTDHGHFLLRARRERPRGRRAAEKGDERASPHSITSSAATSSLSGTLRPSILAVGALMTSSNLLDCTTGNSAGFAPLRIRPA